MITRFSKRWVHGKLEIKFTICQQEIVAYPDAIMKLSVGWLFIFDRPENIEGFEGERKIYALCNENCAVIISKTPDLPRGIETSLEELSQNPYIISLAKQLETYSTQTA